MSAEPARAPLAPGGRWTRRTFLATTLGAGGALIAGCTRPSREIPGEIVGASAVRGHRLRSGGFPPAEAIQRCAVVIVGGGIAGLAAARSLRQQGIEDFLLVELEDQTGGNSASGRNPTSAYPWGAHYVTLPTADAHEVIGLYEELGLITGRDPAGRPVYLESALVMDPAERLFVHGRWQDGLLPKTGASDAELKEFASFASVIGAFKNARGTDGRRAFTIPVDRSSRDERFLALDRLSMAEWMQANGWNSPPLRWYVNYACRDDFGGTIDQVSAWAGLHYFAARDGAAANAESEVVLTWPEGNGWLAHRLREPLGDRIHAASLAWEVDATDGGVRADVFDFVSGRSLRIEAHAAIVCVPRFVARRIVAPLRAKGEAPLEYGPWVVANITVRHFPSGPGAPPAWDSVFQDSPSLGYVNATHQTFARGIRPTVLTWYQALCDGPVLAERAKALERTHGDWCELILADLRRVHEDIDSLVERIDVCVWGHGMIRPVPGSMWSGRREQMAVPIGGIHFAHSDLSGISIFEEAFTRGTLAGAAVAEEIRRNRPS